MSVRQAVNQAGVRVPRLFASIGLVVGGGTLTVVGNNQDIVWGVLTGAASMVGGFYIARPLAKAALEWMDRRGL